MAKRAEASSGPPMTDLPGSKLKQTYQLLSAKLKNSPPYAVALIACAVGFSADPNVGSLVWAACYALIVAMYVWRLKRGQSWNKAIRGFELPFVALTVAVAPLLVTASIWPWLVLGGLAMFGLAVPLSIDQFESGRLRVENLPKLATRRFPERGYRALLVFAICLPAVIVALSRQWVPAPVVALISAGFFLWAGMVSLAALQSRNDSRQAVLHLRNALMAVEPVFVLHWAAPSDTDYQIRMWLPYLRRIGLPFAIIVRNRASFDDAVALADGEPVILAESARMLERSIVPSLRAAFYVNNSDRNAHLVRFARLTHIQLLHGDSEKAPSHNPVTAMFDRIYVAGEAAIDRYAAHDIAIPNEKFAVVGRPQVEGVARADMPRPAAKSKTVLYAPTWAGLYEDSSYSSLLSIGPVLELLLEEGCTIIFRSHPYSARSPELAAACDQIRQRLRRHSREQGAAHVYGPKAENEMTLTDCFNACDVMVADVSSVVSDFLFSGKPLALMTGEASPEQLLAELPLAEAAYVLSTDDPSWRGRVKDFLGEDSLRDVRREMRAHYLGDFPAATYADVFVRTAREDVLGTSAVVSAIQAHATGS